MKSLPGRFIKKSLIAFAQLMLLMPLARTFSPSAMIGDSSVWIVYLPYGMSIATLYIFGRAAILPLLLAFYLNYQYSYPFLIALGVTLAMLIPVLLCGWLARKLLGKRWRYSPANNGVGIRLTLIGTCAPVLTKFMMIAWGHFFPVPDAVNGYFSSQLNMYTVVSLQNMIISAVVFTILFYIPLRGVSSPAYARRILLGCKKAFGGKQSLTSALAWLGMLVTLLILFCSPVHHLLISSYLIPLIFVLFTYGIMRFDQLLVTFLWALSCFLLMYCNVDVLTNNNIFAITFMSSTFIAFTISLVYISAAFSKSQRMQQVAMRLSLIDPIEQRPNLRALAYHLRQQPMGTLCYLHLDNLKFLGRHYGIMMRIHCKRSIIDMLNKLLGENEGVYQLAGDGLMLFLTEDVTQQRLESLREQLKDLRVYWNNTVVDINYAFAAAPFNVETDDLYRLTGQLSYLAERALTQGGISLLDGKGGLQISSASEQVLMLARIKQAIASRRIMLCAQPIVNPVTAHSYYEVLARLQDGDEIIQPNEFIPLIAEFNLSASFDRLVIEETVAFIEKRRKAGNPLPCMAINLLPMTLTEPGIAESIVAIFQRYGVPHDAAILEVTEEQSLYNSQAATQAIEVLRHQGFRIAIDDFGTGFANYERVKSLKADIIKIDGLFVKNIEHDRLDRMIVKSICDIAKEKKLSVVAEYVETVEQGRLLTQLGVGYLQGYLHGKPSPLETLP